VCRERIFFGLSLTVLPGDIFLSGAILFASVFACVMYFHYFAGLLTRVIGFGSRFLWILMLFIVVALNFFANWYFVVAMLAVPWTQSPEMANSLFEHRWAIALASVSVTSISSLLLLFGLSKAASHSR
jgi:hypothetical protein